MKNDGDPGPPPVKPRNAQNTRIHVLCVTLEKELQTLAALPQATTKALQELDTATKKATNGATNAMQELDKLMKKGAADPTKKAATMTNKVTKNVTSDGTNLSKKSTAIAKTKVPKKWCAQCVQSML